MRPDSDDGASGVLTVPINRDETHEQWLRRASAILLQGDRKGAFLLAPGTLPAEDWNEFAQKVMQEQGRKNALFLKYIEDGMELEKAIQMIHEEER